MKLRSIVLPSLLLLLLASCDKNTTSKIPMIELVALQPQDSMVVNTDTCFIIFDLTDGDGDIGNSSVSGIYLKDSRYGTYSYTDFPKIDENIEDPKKGLEGRCVFIPFPAPTPRLDSGHMKRDTLSYELYITDRAGHESNHLVTHSFVVHTP